MEKQNKESKRAAAAAEQAFAKEKELQLNLKAPGIYKFSHKYGS